MALGRCALVLRGRSWSGGRPASTETALVTRTRRNEFRIQSEVALLTYGGIAGLEHWHRFVAFVRQSLKKWGVRSWGATLEAYETEGLHAHLVLHFTKALDKRTARTFAFEEVLPNVSCGDYLGEGLD